MSPFNLNLEKTRNEPKLVLVEPALNAFGSMLLITKAENDPGIHEWVLKTHAKMSNEELFRHKLVTVGFYYSIQPKMGGISFETYLDQLEATPPSEFRDVLLNKYAAPETCITEASQKDKGRRVDWDEILSSAKNYIDF